MDANKRVNLSVKAIEFLQEKLGDSISIEKYSFEGEANRCHSVCKDLNSINVGKTTPLPKTVVEINVTLSIALEYPLPVDEEELGKHDTCG